MSAKTPRFHVQLGDKRTTVSIDRTLTELMALKLGEQPYSEEAHQAIRLWLQDKLDEANDPGRYKVSQWLQSEIVHALVDNNLSKLYWEWFDTRILRE